MAVAPYDPLAQSRQRELRLYASDVQASINPSTPGQIPARPLGGSAGSTSQGDGLGRREDGWSRSERYQQLAGDNLVGRRDWQAFSGGNTRGSNSRGSAQIDGAVAAQRAAVPKLEIPKDAPGHARQSLAFDYAASFQEHARDWSRSLGSSRR